MSRTAVVSSSRTHDVYESLRAELLNGRLVPDTRLKINEICQSLGVSVSAVREALSRLTSEGLVIAEPQRGFNVAPVSANELTDLTRVRARIEGLCLERAIAVGDLDWEAQIVASFHRLSRTPKHDADEPDRMSDARSAAHAAFHTALVSGCDSPWLLRLRETLYVQGERYRRLSVVIKGVTRDLNREHQDIMDATLARDTLSAQQLMTKHLELTTKLLLTEARLAIPVTGPGWPIDPLSAPTKARIKPSSKIDARADRAPPNAPRKRKASQKVAVLQG